MDTKAVQTLIDSINNLRVDDISRGNLLRVLEGLVHSKNNKLYVTKTDSSREFISLRQDPEVPESELSFCIVEKMINVLTGATEGSRYSYPSLAQVSEYVNAHKDVLNSEIIDIINSQRNMDNMGESEEQSPYEQLRDQIGELQIPTAQKARLQDILNIICKSPIRRIPAYRDATYTEYVALDPKLNEFYLMIKNSDPYGSSGIRGQDQKLSLKALAKYVEEHKTTMDPMIQELRKEHPEIFGEQEMDRVEEAIPPEEPAGEGR